MEELCSFSKVCCRSFKFSYNLLELKLLLMIYPLLSKYALSCLILIDLDFLIIHLILLCFFIGRSFCLQRHLLVLQLMHAYLTTYLILLLLSIV